MLYSLMRAILFRFDAEKAHHLGLQGIALLNKLKLTSFFFPPAKGKPVQVMGIEFPNRVGLAAGLDKNGDYLSGLSALGFGLVEIGTVTPKPQAGNEQPRLFRLPEAHAIINRMGFNNLGVDHLVAQVKAVNVNAVVGINIGKNKLTPEERAVEDYLICFEKVYPYADYITINISSPNTPGLRNLQFGDSLKQLLRALKDKQAACHQQSQRYVPMAVKVAPDLTEQEVKTLAATFTEFEVDAVIATNTTMARDKVAGLPHADEAGGLSGEPVFEQATEIVRLLKQALPETMPIIAAGGIMSGEDAKAKIAAGASLVQIYSGFIYQGPALIRECINATKEL